MGWVVNATPLPLCPLETGGAPILQEAGEVPGTFWNDKKNLAPTRIRSLDWPVVLYSGP
jgi:hypothetical protein